MGKIIKTLNLKNKNRVVAAVLILALTFSITPLNVNAEGKKATAGDATSGNATSGNATSGNATAKITVNTPTDSPEPGEPLFRDNIKINGRNIGGLTRKQVMGIFCATDTDAVPVTFTSQYGDVNTTLGELDCKDNSEEVIDEALAYGNKGTILKRYRDIESLKTTPIEYTIKKEIDPSIVGRLVEDHLNSLIDDDETYTLNHNDDGTVYVIANGEMNKPDSNATAATVEQIINQAGYAGDPISANVVFSDDSLNDRAKLLQRITTELGSYATDYSGSSESRKVNVQRAASLVDGHVVFPGEQFSVYDVISPIEESNGYAMGHAFVGTDVVDSVGGGVCQVATTLYNAVLRAELEVTQRYCHSMPVSYVPISADAAIAGGLLDLKFVNNLEVPIYIEAGYDGGTVRFSIYGEEYRPANRTIDFESVQLSVINPPSEPILTEDKTIPPGTQVVKSEAVTGYTAELWKHIYIDGVLTDSIRINESEYDACAQKISINTDAPVAGDPNNPEDPNNPDGSESPDNKTNKTDDKKSPDKPEDATVEPTGDETPIDDTPTDDTPADDAPTDETPQ